MPKWCKRRSNYYYNLYFLRGGGEIGRQTLLIFEKKKQPKGSKNRANGLQKSNLWEARLESQTGAKIWPTFLYQD